MDYFLKLLLNIFVEISAVMILVIICNARMHIRARTSTVYRPDIGIYVLFVTCTIINRLFVLLLL